MSEKDIVEEARAVLAASSRIHALNDTDPKKDEDVGWLLHALADEVERLRKHIKDLDHDFDALVKEADASEETMMRKMYHR